MTGKGNSKKGGSGHESVFYRILWHQGIDLKSKFLIIGIILFASLLGSSCSTDPTTSPIEKPEVDMLVDEALEDYFVKIDANWENLTWKNSFFLAPSYSEISDSIWKTTGFYESYERITNSSLNEDQKEEINEVISGIFEVKDPDFYGYFTIYSEEFWSYFVFFLVVAIVIGLLTKDILAGLLLAWILEFFLYFLYFFIFVPGETEYVQEKLTERVMEAKVEIQSISEEIYELKL